MSIDINKIIQESVQETLNSQEDEQPLEETTKEENIEESADNKEETTQENTEEENSFDPAAASAISAGLGALTFRNHYRALKEQADGKKGMSKKSKVATGLGIGVAGGSAAGLAASDNIKKSVTGGDKDPHKSTRETLKTIAARKETDKDPHSSVRSNLKKLAPKKDNDSSSWKDTVGDTWSGLKKLGSSAKEYMTTIPDN